MHEEEIMKMSLNQKKEYKSIEKQVEYLVETKNIIYSDNIADVLSERAYTSIINPYKRIFAKGKDDNGHVYDGQINFEKYIELAVLDDYFSYHLFKWISIFERKLKVTLAYTISSYLAKEGDNEGVSYVKELIEYFRTKDPNHLDKIGLIPLDTIYTRFGKQVASEAFVKAREEFLHDKILKTGTSEIWSKNNLVKYYQQNHNKVPFWLLVHDHTLGELQVLNGLLKKTLKDEVYLAFHPIKSKASADNLMKFSGQIELLRNIRNIVSHNESIIGFLQNAKTNDLEQFFQLIQLLKSTNESSIISKSSMPNLSTYVDNDFNRKTLKNISRLLDELG